MKINARTRFVLIFIVYIHQKICCVLWNNGQVNLNEIIYKDINKLGLDFFSSSQVQVAIGCQIEKRAT